jgi:hypothetical protein
MLTLLALASRLFAINCDNASAGDLYISGPSRFETKSPEAT